MLERAARTARRCCGAAVAVVVGAATAAVPGAGTAAADPIDPFYFPPESFSATPGSVIRDEALPIFAGLPDPDRTWPIDGRRVMYTSRTQDDEPVAVTGTFVNSARPWTGPGERPTVIIAPGTSGQGDQCAPSAAFSTGVWAKPDPPTLSVNQEAVSAAMWSARGARVFVTDYIGLGTPGIHTYLNRAESAHAVLDAARAAGATA